MPSPILASARFGIASVTVGLALPACGDDGPSGPAADFDIVAQWSYAS